MSSYKAKLIDEISELNDEQARKFCHIFQAIKKEFLIVRQNDWKEDFKNVSVWENDNLGPTEDRLRN